ncbi:circularly permuted type 2 ATP-grasp protein [Altererythrobacter arenosus]|uniref:Circularly permuted type 2 ATP-grasp protein n=1 Tax=Altererythrobacter arenosus TaxID=3032592 RepID=A0ABY8FSP9_9SPHN|nr:circularly permuted type 2 ATP-grasp protein [Altererythrobacter sp. CAU 1644]WFL76456.1 circularly permuted type 2 ATP-grasp protein [Altererythrobacter sp. CAU 1644]
MNRGSVKFDEMHDAEGGVREAYSGYCEWFHEQDTKSLKRKDAEADENFRRTGITFNVYGEDEAEERLIPFDMVPRIITANEWRKLTRGIEQRVSALNSFLYDLYHRQEIIRAGRIPERLLRNNEAFLQNMVGFTPPGGIYTHIVGIDLVRTGPDEFFVLEDNARTPSGVSYMLQNRETMMSMFPELFTRVGVETVSNYPRRLARSLAACAPQSTEGKPNVAVLTPGIYNSAYFEHAFLADQMGAELVEASDLRVVDGKVQMRCTAGYQPIDVLYRRVDDDYLDPLTFNPDSVLGIPGIMDVYRAGNITIANAPGTGVSDDKAVYSFMPEIVEFYTGEKPLLPNVETWRCADRESLKYVLDNLAELVVKEVHGSGGYGMLIGPTASRREIADFRKKLEAHPENYIAQPTLSLSTCPIFTKKGLAPRHVDLRPFVLVSPNGIDITPGGLTRVALEKGSLVVNSSQGGGTKDTWVLKD